MAASNTTEVTVTGLYIYPVKSARGLSVNSARLGPRGFVNDRRWLVVSAKTNAFVTQRESPKLTLIQPEFVGDTLVLHYIQDGNVVSTSPAVSMNAESEQGAETREVKIWDDRVTAIDCGDDIAEWLSEKLRKNVRLVTTGKEHERAPGEPEYLPTDDSVHPSISVSYQDGYPLFVASEASLQAVNERCEAEIIMENFRPNIVVNGCAAFAEDDWVRVVVGNKDSGVELLVVKPCERCTIPTVDYEKGVKRASREPSTALEQFREIDGAVYFGQNIVQTKPNGTLFLGDTVHVMETHVGIRPVDKGRAGSAAPATPAVVGDDNNEDSDYVPVRSKSSAGSVSRCGVLDTTVAVLGSLCVVGVVALAASRKA